MGKPKTDKGDIVKIIKLRKSGLSIDSIHRIVPQGRSTIYRYIKDLKVDFNLRGVGSKNKSIEEWKQTQIDATRLMGGVNRQSKMFVLASLYWGEGNKRELNIIKSDPELIRIFILCLKELGIIMERLKISLRLFEDINHQEAKVFWSKVTGIDQKKITSIETIKGKKKGKLKYGMCRVRVQKSRYYFKIIMNMIDVIKKDIR